MKWSKFQKDVFKNTAKGSGHTFVEAVAGSGKSTSLIESLNYVPDGTSWLLVAFNRKIAAELKMRAPQSFNGETRTLHSLGLKALKQRYPNVDVESNKMWKILDRVVGKDRKFNDIKNQMNKAVSLCKACLVSEPAEIDVILDEYDIDVFDMDRDEFISKINKAMLKSYEDTDCVDFNDMVWLPHMYDIKAGSYQRVFIDEAQDMNPAMLELALSACAKSGRITLYGDRNQAIYGFNGAGSDQFNKLIKSLDAKILPLSISYRCPVKVVNKAKQFVPIMEAAPNAKQGTVEYISSKEMLKLAKPGCFILSRVNAPLIGLALGFIRQGTPCNIQGRDIGANLVNLIKKSRRKSIDTFLNWLGKWEAKEIKRLRVRGRPVGSVTDKAGCLRALADDCRTIAEMKGKIQELFEDDDDNNRIILSTVHRAKGLQRDVVFLLSGTFFGGNQEEENIKYVACTRSASELYYVTGTTVPPAKSGMGHRQTRRAGMKMAGYPVGSIPWHFYNKEHRKLRPCTGPRTFKGTPQPKYKITEVEKGQHLINQPRAVGHGRKRKPVMFEFQKKVGDKWLLESGKKITKD
ncbi:hypothetical protein LCGC14_0478560 [marine sediment metagenome]|uniref:UvrD-like helicase ATP-binding domain-containing protein n=1 Tax=marine sediment metagenome TaxID=412755 RepID=A0A0F9SSZ5_9ZZZZ